MIKYTFIFLIFNLFLYIQAKKLPSYVRTCKRSDPKLGDCLVHTTLASIRPYLAKGIPKMKIPALEPFYIKKLEVDRDVNGLKLKLLLNEVKAWGGSRFLVDNVTVNLDKLEASGTVIIPAMSVISAYEIAGKALGVELGGKGMFKGNITNTKVDIKGTGFLSTDANGHEMLRLRKLSVKARIGDAQGVAINQDDNKRHEELTINAMKLYNDNRREILNMITPIVEDLAANIALETTSTVLKTATFDEFLPKD